MALQELPTGTVTFLFTDIEGSTRLLTELGATAYAAVLDDHRVALRAAFAGHGGVEIDTQGDAFFVAFPTPSGALAAAAAAQAALASGPVRVRMGLHTGEPTMTAEGYVGMDVHRAARIAGAAHGGQVVLSSATRQLVDADVLDLGEHRLKDLSAAERLYQLGSDAFPPLRTLGPSNIPVPPTPFLGRERELSELAALLASPDVRLLTLTGPGGSGKTRLAAQVAGAATERYPNGVWWVFLAGVHDPAGVLETIASTIGATGELHSFLRSRTTLLLLDTFEHLLDAAVDVAELLAACPGLDIVATSRAPLHVAAEHRYAVQPLRQEDAIALFRQRVVAVGGPVDDDGSISALCQRLDCLPLALELAAARTSVLSPAAILRRLDRALPLLTGGARDAPERQRTLRATIAWSHDLLDADEKALFARLSVFAGPASLDAVEDICEADLETLASLVSKSLLRQAGDRFWMLGTIREFAAEQLEAAELDALLDRHGRWFLELAERDGGAVRSDHSGAALARLGADRDNLMQALASAVERGDAEVALRLAAALRHYLDHSGQVTAGRALVEAALLLPGAEAKLASTPNAVTAAAHLAMRQSDAAGQRRHSEHLLRIAEATGSAQIRMLALIYLGICDDGQETVAESLDALQQALELAVELGDRTRQVEVLSNLGSVCVNARRYDEALDYIERCLAAGAAGDAFFSVYVYATSGVAHYGREEDDLAAEDLLTALVGGRQRDHQSTVSYALLGLAATVSRHAPRRAARLLGFHAAYNEESGMGLDWADRALHQETRGRIVEAIGEEALQAGHAEGARATLEALFPFELERVPASADRELLFADDVAAAAPGVRGGAL